MKQEGDLNKKQIMELSSELKFRRENIRDAELQLAHLNTEIQNEKEMMLQEDIRHSNSIKEYELNQSELISLHNQIISDLESKITDMNMRISGHQKQADYNVMMLIKQKNNIISDTDKRTDRHNSDLEEMQILINSQKNSERFLTDKKQELD